MGQEIEKILVIETKQVENIGNFNKNDCCINVVLDRIFNGSTLFFLDRDLAEQDFNFKQIIPYVVVTSNNKFLTYKRTKKSGEDRLKNLHSLGFGGHINEDDRELVCGFDTYVSGLDRELREELGLSPSDFISSTEIIGFINDNSNEVGKVHFGIVNLLVINPGKIHISDPAISDIQWFSKHELKDSNLEFENWSKILLDNNII